MIIDYLCVASSVTQTDEGMNIDEGNHTSQIYKTWLYKTQLYNRVIWKCINNCDPFCDYRNVFGDP